jgi:hypothetical protein
MSTLAKIYAAVGAGLILAYAAVAMTGMEFGTTRFDDTPPSQAYARSGRSGGGGWYYGGGGGFGGGK